MTNSDIADVLNDLSKLMDLHGENAFKAKALASAAVLHRKYCGRCHLPPDDEDAAYAAGIPLHGQRSEYLRFAHATYFTGDRESLLDKMAEKMRKLKEGDLDRLIHYYSSYRSPD